jgi:RHS repeat-associated protein
VTKYYTHGGSRVAMRRGDALYYLNGDHLGSTSLTTGDTGNIVSEVRYLPYGEERWTNGATPTDFTFTGQRNEAGFGLMDYNARYYSARLGRFVSPDTVVPEPGSGQGFNRYAYVMNNPLNYIDPSGHCREEDENYSDCTDFADEIVSEIGSDTTWDGVNVYDLNWQNEDQVENFVSQHNALPEKLRRCVKWTLLSKHTLSKLMSGSFL